MTERTCTVDGCGQPASKRGWCASHYQQQLRSGKPPVPFLYKWANEPFCIICGAPNGAFRSRKFCSAACQQFAQRHPGKTRSDLVHNPCEGCGEPILRTGARGVIRRYCSPDCRPRCDVEGCQKPTHGDVYCMSHHTQWKRYGDPLTPVLWTQGEGEYDAVHHRLRTHRGVARELVCVDCGGPAEEWSYDHDDPDELLHTKIRESMFSKTPPKYSRDLSHYSPRCVPCHRSFDRRQPS